MVSVWCNTSHIIFVLKVECSNILKQDFFIFLFCGGGGGVNCQSVTLLKAEGFLVFLFCSFHFNFLITLYFVFIQIKNMLQEIPRLQAHSTSHGDFRAIAQTCCLYITMLSISGTGPVSDNLPTCISNREIYS